MNKTFLIFSLGIVLLGLAGKVWAQVATTSATPDTSGQVADLGKQIADYESKIANLQGQEQTLSSQIQTMDTNIKLTTLRIASTKQQIVQVTGDIAIAAKKITTLEESLTGLTKILLSRIVATYEVGGVQPVQLFASSNSIGDFFTRANYLRVAQAHDKELIYDTVQAKNDYANQKTIFEDQKKRIQALQDQLVLYNQELDSQKSQKQALLTQTQGSEENYQKLVSQARAQLAGFSRFVTSQGGASLLSGQTFCDDWGCYYNQRDSQWGGALINGQRSCGPSYNEPCTMASYGCLISSVSMVISHMGHREVLPVDIAMSSNSNFSVNTADLAFNINVKGVSIVRAGAGSLDTALQSGPVIVGISYDGGRLPDHFVVLKSGSGGNYVMDDPFTPNGHDISFTSKYSVGSIREVDRVVVN